MIELGDNIRKARKKMGLTQEELASQIGVTSQAVSRWESGAGMPDISIIVPLARVLKVSTDTLFGYEELNQDNAQYMELMKILEDKERGASSSAQAALQKCEYLSKELETNPANYIYACCFVECAAGLSRFVDFDGYALDIWPSYKNKAIISGTQVIRFCQVREWVERTHFALAWIYIHEKDYSSAREHINMLPSVDSNRLQEGIMSKLTYFEYGFDEMKKTVNHELQMFTRAFNKVLLYAMENYSWNGDPKEAVEFGLWGIGVMEAVSKNKDMLPYCRGFYRDIYKFLIQADIRADEYNEAAKHWNELIRGMQYHYEYYQKVLDNEAEVEKYTERQLRHMRNYTQNFIKEKQDQILCCLKDWQGQEKQQKLIEAINHYQG